MPTGNREGNTLTSLVLREQLSLLDVAVQTTCGMLHQSRFPRQASGEVV